MDTDYVVAIDDSGGIEPLVKWGGKFVKGDHPITAVTALILRTELLNEFDDRWIDLRSDIQRYLGCDHLPPIHCRIMYGRTLSPTYRDRPNPYFGCPFEKIVEWFGRAFAIIEDVKNQKQAALTWSNRVSLRENAYRVSMEPYFSDPALQAELNFLKQRSVGRRKEMAQKYLNRMSSPLLPLLTFLMLQVNEYMVRLGGKTLSLKVDRFAEAHGLDTEDVLTAINQVGRLEYIRSIGVIADSDDSQLSQAADLIGYWGFRQTMGKYGYIKFDSVLEDIVRKNLTIGHFTKANVTHIIERRLQQKKIFTSPIHYAAARLAIENIDREFADEYMLTVAEFNASVVNNQKKLKGYSILKPQIVEALLNGDDPG